MANKSVKGPMSVDKSSTPSWMRAVIWVIVVTFVLGGVGIGVLSFGGSGSGTQNGATAGSADSINATYQPRVDTAITAAEANPTNPEIVVQVANAYYDWAVELYTAGQQQAAIPLWLSAVSYYDKVLALTPDNVNVMGDKAFALYYGNSDNAAAALQTFIDAAATRTDLAQQVESASGLLAELQASQTTTTAP